MVEKNLVEGSAENPPPADIRSVVARSLLSRLTTECKAYCILTGYEQFPDSFDSDIDFMVDKNDFERMPRIMDAIADDTGTQLFQSVQHEITARAFLLVSQSGHEVTLIQPDSTNDYRHFGPLWLRADEMLASRRWHPKGFWIPGAAHEFIYYLIKRLSKRDFSPQHGVRLHGLYTEDPQTSDQLLARFWSGSRRQALIRMAASGDWAEMFSSLEAFRSELMNHDAESVVQKITSGGEGMHHFIDRVVHPTGGWIAFMGPDGCGKSSVIETVSKTFAPAFRNVDRYHMQPKILRKGGASTGTVTDPHGLPPRGLLASILKIFYLVTDYWLGYLLRIRPAMIRTGLVIFDRYIYDLLVDSKRVRYGGPAWLLKLAARIVPGPELVILLDAPPEVLWTRKQEVSFEEVARQQQAYLQLAHQLPSAIIIDAAQPLPDVLHDVSEAVIAHFARRTAARLRLR